MFKVVSPRFRRLTRCVASDSVKRFFLSNAYRCEEAWANRLKNPIFQKADANNLYHGLDICFQKKKPVSVLDVDILLSGVRDSSYKNELEDVLLRLRLVPECVILPERTSHAALRWYIDNASKEDLLNVLSDRLNYGLFPDYYLNNVLMDKYLKEKDAVAAVKIAVLQMLQEDFGHPIMKVLGLHCCYSYLDSPEIWETYKEPEPDPDDEVKKVRVSCLRNPYFDDHFDIVNTNHLVGKTLWLFGQTVDGAVGASSQLVGLVLYEKYDKCAEFLENVIREGRKLHSDAVAKAEEYVLKTPKQAEVEASGADAADDGQEKKEEVQPVKMDAVDGPKKKVLELLKKIGKKNLEKGTLLSATADLVKKAVAENESADIKHQCELYKQWEKDREDSIQKEIKRAELEKVKSEVQQIKEELEEEEEKIFFFDTEEELQMKARSKEREKKMLVFYRGKRRNKEDVVEEYVPPDVSQKKRGL